MDGQVQRRERVFSILNDNDSPSFQIPYRGSRSQPEQHSSRHEQPILPRQTHLRRTPSISSTISSVVSGSCSVGSSCNSPVLHRLDSADLVSRSSGDSMDSSPSPATPAYGYPEAPLAPYDAMIRQDGLPSSANVTPFMEQPMMLGAPGSMAQHVPAKPVDGLAPNQQYPILPSLLQTDLAPLPNLAFSHNPTASFPSSTTKAASPLLNPPFGKKNKYPCPYAQSHNCAATFTTSGHAARHGKKHTGEKGVHCPVCNKAFTRKDNMKQHERTHKVLMAGSNSEDSSTRRSSKALVTREAQKNRAVQQDALTCAEPTPPQSLPLIPPGGSQCTDSAVGYENALALGNEPVNASLISSGPVAQTASPSSIYPPLADDGLQVGKPPKLTNTVLPPLPPLARGFSDLDTLAQVAENFDPFYQPIR